MIIEIIILSAFVFSATYLYYKVKVDGVKLKLPLPPKHIFMSLPKIKKSVTNVHEILSKYDPKEIVYLNINTLFTKRYWSDYLTHQMGYKYIVEDEENYTVYYLKPKTEDYEERARERLVEYIKSNSYKGNKNLSTTISQWGDKEQENIRMLKTQLHQYEKPIS